MRPFTERIPKAFLPLMGVPIAQFAVDSLVEAGIRKIVMNVHHHPELAKSAAANLELDGAQLAISDESRELLGSAGGIRHAMPQLGRGAFLYLNADVLSDLDLASVIRAHDRNRRAFGALVTLAVLNCGPEDGRYRELRWDSSGRLTELGDLVQRKPFFCGAAVLEPDALRHVPATGSADFVSTILEPLLKNGRVGVHLAEANWEDIGEPRLWLRAHLNLIRRLETGNLSPRIRKRIESSSRRVASMIWVSKNSPRRIRNVDWCGPAYWSSQRDSREVPPKAFGPNAVFYAGLGHV